MIFLSLFFLGVQLGATSCALSCLPIITPILLSAAQNKNQALQILGQYFGAKVLAYTLIGLVAYFGLALIKNALGVFPIRTIGAIILILTALMILYDALIKEQKCQTSCHSQKYSNYFWLGFFSSFNLCLPIISLISISAMSHSFWISLSYGFIFGLGVVSIPIVFFYFFVFRITSTLLEELHTHKKTIKITSALLLMIVGVLVFFGIINL